MRRYKLALGLLLALSLPATTQDFPKVEASTGYMYMRFNPSAGPTANCNGGYGSITANFNDWFGLAGNVDACATNRTSPASNGTAVTFLFGPKFAYRKCCRVTPFGQVLIFRADVLGVGQIKFSGFQALVAKPSLDVHQAARATHSAAIVFLGDQAAMPT
jgi:hypothetical protein